MLTIAYYYIFPAKFAFHINQLHKNVKLSCDPSQDPKCWE